MPTRPEFAPMVRWFGPAQLLRTAGSVVISKVFGAVFDRRRLDARLSSGEPLIHDLTRDESGRPRERLVLDYVADTGDGWNSTYAVAYWSARPELTVRAPDGGAEVTTRRGDVLIFGGDLVYPAPNRGAYQQRLVTPFTSALGEPHGERPQVFAIPGNHDWYDNLAHFTRLFVDADEFAGRAAPQRRSYFALELPRGWWLLGVDIQLSSDIDRDQVAYFREVAARVRARATSRDEPANVILCTAEPYWIYEHEADLDNPKARALQRAVLENNLNFLERHVFKDHPIRVYLAGDLHHYRRHASDDARTQRVTAGGGGAFLHPTHNLSTTPLADGCALRSAYPDPATSRRLTWRDLLFPIVSPTFGLLTGLLYLYVGWYMIAEMRRPESYAPVDILSEVARALASSPGAGTSFAIVIGGFILFTDTRKRWYRVLGGGLHGVAHVTAMTIIVGLLGAAASALGWELLGLGHLGASIVALFIGGWLIGSLIMGAYLFLSLRVFKTHTTEGFSGLAIEDYKHFLRLVIDDDGSLTIYPIGIDRVPRRWSDGPEADAGGPAFVPAPGDPATAPRLIEPPVRVPR